MREKITVLIADDNQEFSMTLATYLKNQEKTNLHNAISSRSGQNIKKSS